MAGTSIGHLIFTLTSSLIVLCSAQEDCCPPLWTQFQGNCYRFVGTPRSWSKAEQQCVQLAGSAGKDGHLVSVHSNEENEFVNQLWKTSLTPVEATNAWVEPSNAIWLGLSDQVNEGEFLWSDESATFFASWRQGEPSGDPEESCGHMWTFGKEDTSWNDARCDIKLPFVCKLDMNSSVIQSMGKWCISSSDSKPCAKNCKKVAKSKCSFCRICQTT